MNETTSVNAVLTPAAVSFIRRMLRFVAGPNAGFNLRVSPGGCSGLAAVFDLAAEPKVNDIVWEPEGLRIFLDEKSCHLLDGAVVDFKESIAQTGFAITTRGTAPQLCGQAATMVPVGSLVRR